MPQWIKPPLQVSGLLAVFLLASSISIGAQQRQESNPKAFAKVMVDSLGVKSGFVAHVGFRDGSLTAELSQGGRFLVHGLGTDAQSVARARKKIQSLGMYGQVSVEHGSLRSLPYATNLVNLIVVNDLSDRLARGLTVAEAMRVLRPNGVAYLGRHAQGGGALSQGQLRKIVKDAGIQDFEIVKQDGIWARIRKPRPRGMGDWTHYRCHANGNPVSTDTSPPPTQLQWISGRGPLGTSAARGMFTLAAVSANGRIYNTVGTAVKTKKGSLRLDKVFLVARDAFNGMRLWVIPYAGGGENVDKKLKWDPKDFYQQTLVAADNRVFVVLDRGLVELNGSSGEIVRDFKTVVSEFVHHQGALIGGGGPGTLRAVDAKTGEIRWDSGLSPHRSFAWRGSAVIAGDQYVFVRAREGTVALDVSTGQKLWQTGHKGQMTYQDNVLIVLDRQGAFRGFSAKDGRPLWNHVSYEVRHGSPGVFVVDDIVWTHGKDNRFPLVGLDLHTGGEISSRSWSPGMLVVGRCGLPVATRRYLLKASCTMLDWNNGETTRLPSARVTCKVGFRVANGLAYQFPRARACICFSSTQDEFRAFSSAETEKAAGKAVAPKESGERFKKGPAYGAVGKEQAAISPDRIAFGCNPDAHQVYALDPRTKGERWRFTAGGRVDHPPEIYRDVCIFGSRNGWVTCLRVGDGKLVWRFRAAPRPRRIIAYGRLESDWPVQEKVLISKDVVYFAAGRASDLPEGILIYGADPLTGEILWTDSARQAIRSTLKSARGGRGLVFSRPLQRFGGQIRMGSMRFTPKLKRK